MRFRIKENSERKQRNNLPKRIQICYFHVAGHMSKDQEKSTNTKAGSKQAILWVYK